MGRNIGKDISKKIEAVNSVRNFLITLNNLQHTQLKLPQKERFKKQQKELVI